MYVSDLNAEEFPVNIAELLHSSSLNELGLGEPNQAEHDLMAALTLESLFAPARIVDQAMAQATFAGLWLLHDCFEESHQISQDLPDATGGYWHAILHRREGDFGNAKYWFGQTGIHPVFKPLGGVARRLASETTDPEAEFLRSQLLWDANRFVDLCRRAVEQDSSLNTLCRQIQRAEWDLLFLYCYDAATGREARP